MAIEDLIQQKTPEYLLTLANAVIDRSLDNGDLKQATADRMRTVLSHSTYGTAYARYVIDPRSKNDGEHNKLVSKMAEEHDINLDKWHSGLEDSGLHIKFKEDKSQSIYSHKVIDLLRYYSREIGAYEQKLSYEDLEQEILEEISTGPKESMFHDFTGDSFLMVAPDDDDVMADKMYSLEVQSGVFANNIDKLKLTIHEELISGTYNLEELIANGKLKEALAQVAYGVQDVQTNTKSWPVSLQDSFLTVYEGINEHAQMLIKDFDATNFHTAISSNAKRISEAEYFCKVEPLPPEDVSFGNDGGCCIAVGRESIETNGDYVPFYQLDLATSIIGVYQRPIMSMSGNKMNAKPKRIGMVLTHAGSLNGVPIQMVNSLELSSTMNPLTSDQLTKLTTHVLNYVDKVGIDSGFKGLAMGNHDYNTAINHIPQNMKSRRLDTICKMPKVQPDGSQFWYSEVFDDCNTSNQDWGWIRKIGEKSILK